MTDSDARANKPRELSTGQLYTRCDPGSLGFTTTAELPDLDGALGQSRALDALAFGARMRGEGYNLFVLGPAGSNRHQIVQAFLEAEAGAKNAAPDWCYVNNFAETRKPIALMLPPGQGTALRDDMDRLIAELREAIPAAFDSEHYRNRVAEINQELEDRHKAAIDQLRRTASERNLSLISTPQGFGIAPIRNGKLLSDEEFDRLSEDDKQQTRQAMEEMTSALRDHFKEVPRWHKAHRENIKALNREVTNLAVGQLIDQLLAAYRDFPQVVTYLHAVHEDVLENARDFHVVHEAESVGQQGQFEHALDRYKVNVIVDHAAEKQAPVVHEHYPNVQNLLGRVEHKAQFGALLTDFTMIRGGALHRANGGYLILDAERVLTEPLSWNSLKRVLYTKEVRIESLGELLSLVSTVSLEPAPIPLDLKVILIGERLIYYLLCELDADFSKLFKVAADFEGRMDRTADNTALYCRLIAAIARREEARPLTRDAVARVVEYSARLVGDAEKLSTRLQAVSDLVREADYWAADDGAEQCDEGHVQRAIDAQIHRLDRIRSQQQEAIARNTILIDTEGERIGQVNGLSVVKLGNFIFGQPSRITATVRLGAGKIIDIERETELGGPIHSKGVLIVASYLGARYASDLPLSLSASLVFEQSYGGVEGDSASVAETCALLSAIADLPVRQSLAVTGSVNQHGVVQVIGGVNEKIEGFFDTCKARGLTGEQGVLIPADNVKHLMLRADVVQAVAAGEFHVYAIRHIDEAITGLTGVVAGERNADGVFPADSVNDRVEQRLIALAESRREFDKTDRAEWGAAERPAGTGNGSGGEADGPVSGTQPHARSKAGTAERSN